MQDTDITVQELCPLMLAHAHLQAVQLSPTLVALYKYNALRLEPELHLHLLNIVKRSSYIEVSTLLIETVASVLTQYYT